jgi:hypothetical protein
MAGDLFLDIPSSVALGIVEMQLAIADIAQLVSIPVRRRRITLLTKYTSVGDVSCGNKSTMGNSFGLKKMISTNFVAPIV